MAVHSKDRDPLKTGLNRIGLKAETHPDTVFNNIGHAINDELLHQGFQELDENKAVGIDNVTKTMYGRNLSANISTLIRKIRKGQYKPNPVKIVDIPKEDGSTRPLAISCFEDKLVQWAVAKILETIYEPVFLSCSYGFRPRRNCHDALRALSRSAYAHKNGAIIEIDIQKCFNRIPHAQLKLLLQQKITDSRFLALIETVITGPVNHDGHNEPTTRGCLQGLILSPVLCNIYLHHVIDIWFNDVKSTHLKGSAELIRYADDMVFVFEDSTDAERVWRVLDKRLDKYGLNLHQDKSGLMKSGSKTAKQAELSGEKMPTFQFLGFTCYWGKAFKGFWRLKYTSRADRFTRALKGIRSYLRDHLNTDNVNETLKGLVRRVKGWVNYHAITDNHKRVKSFLYEVQKSVYKWFNRKGCKRSLKWEHLPYWLSRANFPKSYKTVSILGKTDRGVMAHY